MGPGKFYPQKIKGRKERTGDNGKPVEASPQVDPLSKRAELKTESSL